MAAAERTGRGYLGRILQLILLAPNIVGRSRMELCSCHQCANTDKV
jgi:hypothetical protein